MKKSKWRRYVAAVYLLLLAVAVILGLVAYIFVTNEPLQGILYGFATELIGAIFIFVFVDQIFRLDEQQEQEEIIEKIEGLRKEVDSKFSPFSMRASSATQLNFDELFSTASHIRIVGYSMRRTLSEHRDSLILAISKGVSLQLLVVDPDSLGGELMKQHAPFPERVDRRFQDTIYNVEKIRRQIQEDSQHFEVRTTSWIPSCSMIIVEDPNHKTIAKITISAPSYRRFSESVNGTLILNNIDHPEHITYFVEQFNLLWSNNTTEIQPFVESVNAI